VIVPLPESHQWANAAAFAQLGAVEHLDQASLTPSRLTDHVLGLLGDPERRGRLSESIAGSMPRDAADRIASALLKSARVG
jgi:UDP-N-acetylglucosamine:LPS N-acetylglucosamine transferase